MGFSEKAKLAVAVYQDVEIKGLHADHIFPKSKGGTDDVANLQFMTPKLNIQKSNHHIELRRWQKTFLQKWAAHEPDAPFLLCAIPAAGKTIAALVAGKQFLDEHSNPCVVVVVPSDNLRRQWRKGATTLGIELQTKEFGTNFKDGFMGAVITYQSLDSSAQLFRKVCASRPVMVILDEPHHCGNKESWGVNARFAFESSRRKLLLSGTPFRTDGQPIPFVCYDGDGVCVAHHRYDYPDALNDGVVRYVAFDCEKGKYVMLEDGGLQQEYELHQSLTPEEAEGRLRKLMNPSGDFVKEQIRRAHQKLINVRRKIPDAAAMAVCIDQQHARDIAKIIHKLTGVVPAICISDEETATETPEDFRKGTKEWIVSVRQVSEGTDIPRLQVLCWLTNVTSELFFRQLIGRVVRVRPKEELKECMAPSDEVAMANLEAWVVLPSDPRLVMHAKLIEKAQKHAIIAEAEVELSRERNTIERPMSVFLGSEHLGTETTVIGKEQYSPTEIARIEEISAEGITLQKAASIFSKFIKGNLFMQAHVASPSQPILVSLEEKEEKLRRVINQKAFRLSKLKECDVELIHKQWPRQATMNITQLESKLHVILEQIRQFKL